MDRQQVQNLISTYQQRKAQIEHSLGYLGELLREMPRNPEPGSEAAVDRQLLLEKIEEYEAKVRNCDEWIAKIRVEGNREWITCVEARLARLQEMLSQATDPAQFLNIAVNIEIIEHAMKRVMTSGQTVYETGWATTKVYVPKEQFEFAVSSCQEAFVGIALGQNTLPLNDRPRIIALIDRLQKVILEAL